MYVSSEKPDAVLDYLEEEGIKVVPEQEWLLRARYGNIDVAIVICRLLPLREEFYCLLMFAPATSNRWEEFVTKIIEQGNSELFKIVARLKPLEVSIMLEDIKIQTRIPPEKTGEAFKAINNLFEMLHEYYKDDPEKRKELELK